MEREMKKGKTAVARRILQLAGMAMVCLLAGNAAADEIYRWVDENGVIHFSDLKPGAAESETIQVEGGPGGVSYSEPVAGSTQPDVDADEAQPMSAAQQRREAIADARKAQREKQAETDRLCERHRARLEQMEPARRVYYRDEQGNEIRMDDTQRVTLVEESRNYITENCH